MEFKISEHDVDRIIISSLSEICRIFWTLLLTNSLKDVMKMVIATGQPLLGRRSNTATIPRQARCRNVLSVHAILTGGERERETGKNPAINYETVGFWAEYLSPTEQ